MGVKMLVSIMVILLICLIPISNARMSGIATVRPVILPHDDCSQDWSRDISNLYVASAPSDAVWKGPETCGTKYSIKCTGTGSALALPEPFCPCTGESVNVTIVGHCLQQTFCTVAHDVLGSVTFILPAAAYMKISSLSAPNITIEYERVY